MSSFSDYSESGFLKVFPAFQEELDKGEPLFYFDPNSLSKQTGVEWDEDEKKSVLSVDFNNEIAEWLFNSNFEEGDRACPEKRAENAWRLVLAHEKGHILMNQKCWSSRLNQDSENDRGKALGIERKGLIASRLDFHVRAAEEALCDTMMLQEAQKMFGDGWKEVGKVLSKIRHAYSGRLPFHVGDRYSTWTAIDRMLEEGKIMDTFEAARLAYGKSVEATGLGKSLAIAVASPFAKEPPREIGERLLEMRRARLDGEETNVVPKVQEKFR